MHKQQKLQIWYSVVHQFSWTCPLPALGGVPVWSTAGANSFCNVSVAEKQRRDVPCKWPYPCCGDSYRTGWSIIWNFLFHNDFLLCEHTVFSSSFTTLMLLRPTNPGEQINEENRTLLSKSCIHFIKFALINHCTIWMNFNRQEKSRKRVH